VWKKKKKGSREGEDDTRGNESKIRNQDKKGSLSIHWLETGTAKYSA